MEIEWLRFRSSGVIFLRFWKRLENDMPSDYEALPAVSENICFYGFFFVSFFPFCNGQKTLFFEFIATTLVTVFAYLFLVITCRSRWSIIFFLNNEYNSRIRRKWNHQQRNRVPSPSYCNTYTYHYVAARCTKYLNNFHWNPAAFRTSRTAWNSELWMDWSMCTSMTQYACLKKYMMCNWKLTECAKGSWMFHGCLFWYHSLKLDLSQSDLKKVNGWVKFGG